jgi:hypothetical protein
VGVYPRSSPMPIVGSRVFMEAVFQGARLKRTKRTLSVINLTLNYCRAGPYRIGSAGERGPRSTAFKSDEHTGMLLPSWTKSFFAALMAEWRSVRVATCLPRLFPKLSSLQYPNIRQLPRYMSPVPRSFEFCVCDRLGIARRQS